MKSERINTETIAKAIHQMQPWDEEEFLSCLTAGLRQRRFGAPDPSQLNRAIGAALILSENEDGAVRRHRLAHPVHLVNAPSNTPVHRRESGERRRYSGIAFVPFAIIQQENPE